MSNVSMAGSHQVSISHDPIEDHTSAGLDQLRAGRDDWPSGGARYARQPSRQMSDMLPSIDASSLRPALLAGAIGLFAAWVVSGMSGSGKRGSGMSALGMSALGMGGSRQARRPQSNRAGRDDWSRRQSSSPSSRGQEPRYSAGPEGQSSGADLSLDAMNP